MKKARYLVGLTGLAPAMMVAAPAGAHATAPTAAGQGGKTVSLGHSMVTASPDTGCTGKNYFGPGSHGNIRFWGWETQHTGIMTGNVCVGTVGVQVSFNKNICKSVTVSAGFELVTDQRVAVYKGTHKVCAKPGLADTSFGIHKSFSSFGAWVAVGSQYDKGVKADCLLLAGTCTHR